MGIELFNLFHVLSNLMVCIGLLTFGFIGRVKNRSDDVFC